MRRRNGYVRDLNLHDIYLNSAIILVIAVIATVLATLLAILEVSTNNNNKETHNKIAAEFNGYPLAERQIIAKFHGVGEDSLYNINPETYLMEILPIDRHAVIHWYLKYWPLLVTGLLVVLSAVIFCSYYKVKNDDYYLSDLPLKQTSIRILFICMFVAWPILLVNWIYMQVFSSIAEDLRQKRQEHREKVRAERAAVEQIAKAELTELPIEQKFSRNAKLTFRRYVQKDAARAQADRIREAEHNLTEAKQALSDAGKTVMQAQRRVGEAEAKLRDEQSAQVEADFTAQQIERDWEKITQMRGVASIKPCYKNRRNKKHLGVNILVKVRVPYQGEFYDFGDYIVTFADNTYRCMRHRSGVKLTATSRVPDYNEDSGFCFGYRNELIANYVRCGRLAEALDLMIESLHSVNSPDAEIEIPDCFRKVKTIEHAKRRLKIRKIFKKEG